MRDFDRSPGNPGECALDFDCKRTRPLNTKQVSFGVIRTRTRNQRFHYSVEQLQAPKLCHKGQSPFKQSVWKQQDAEARRDAVAPANDIRYIFARELFHYEQCLL